MTKTRSTKRSLFMSGLALLMCVSMLIGSTFAWFTDSVTSTGNIITSGTLDVEMYWADGAKALEGANWTDASDGAIFDYDLWEPGYIDAKHIKISNVGSLALRYQLRIVANGTVSALGDVIDVYYFDSATQLTRETVTNGTKLGTLTEILGTEKNLSNTVCGELLSKQEKTVTIAFKMQESAGNEYQNLSIGTDFSVELIAVQHTYEKDSFDDSYDKNALSAAVPAALVRELEDKNIKATLGIGGIAEYITLDTAYKFQPTQSYEDLLKSEYKYYMADFIVSADNDVPAGSIALAGYYHAWCQYNDNNWVAMVNDGLEVKAGQEIALVEALGAAVHYKDICEYGNDGIGFLCGAADLTGQNVGTTLTVKLCLFETTADPNGSSASYERVEGAEPIVIGEFKYTFGGQYVTASDGAVYFYSDDGDVILYDTQNVKGEDFVVPEGVTKLGNFSFSYGGIKNVVLSDTVRSLGRAFDTSSVEKVVLNEGLEKIDSRAFKAAKNLKEVVISSTVKVIEDNAFQKAGITNITIPATVETIGETAFGASKLETVTIEGNTAIQGYAFRACPNLRKVYLNGDDVTFIASTLNGRNSMWFCNAESNNKGVNNLTFYVKNDTVSSRVLAAMGVGSDVYVYMNGQLHASIEY
ncbi:MAG: leucine-rich repeat protein [Oscillospiraceae bacterium]|nr:leucine-rich repeat protein [Oscillospiraceae bacterium]MBQ8549761.1 leucine-rich repeat protein [Clostridia bacterium]